MRRSVQTILIYFSDLGLGGIQRKIVDLVTYHQQVSPWPLKFIVLLRHRPPFNLESEIPEHVTLVYEPKLPFLKRYQQQWLVFFIWWQLIVYRPQTILTFFQTNLPQLLQAVAGFIFYRLPVIVSQDTILSLYNQPAHIDQVIDRTRLQKWYSAVTTIIVQTQAAALDLQQKLRIPQSKVRVIPNWVSPSVKPDTQISGARPIDVIFYGRFAAQKNLSRLVKCLSQLVVVKPELQVYLIGEGPQREELLTELRQRALTKNVRVLKSTKQISRYLKRAKILILTSKFEGMPLVVLEAMMMGTVPVVTHFPGVEEYIHTGVNGIVTQTVAEQVETILDLLSNTRQRRRLAQQAQEGIQRDYSLENMQAVLAELIKR